MPTRMQYPFTTSINAIMDRGEGAAVAMDESESSTLPRNLAHADRAGINRNHMIGESWGSRCTEMLFLSLGVTAAVEIPMSCMILRSLCCARCKWRFGLARNKTLAS